MLQFKVSGDRLEWGLSSAPHSLLETQLPSFQRPLSTQRSALASLYLSLHWLADE